MTRIITLCSGLERAGKTHIGINLACEQVRRGRHAALYSQSGSQNGIDEMLKLPGMEALQRRSTDHGDALLRRSYLGVDVFSSGIPLSLWGEASVEAVDSIIADMECSDGSDALLVDTSGMDPRTLMACCMAASTVVAVITPEARSCAETFAMLRILKHNGFQGELCLVINQVEQAEDANELYAAFRQSLKDHLGIDVTLLGAITRDVHVPRAERAKQAFTCIFPDTAASAELVAIADALDAHSALKEPAGQSLVEYWNAFRERLARPLSLPGGVFLAESECSPENTQLHESHEHETVNDMMLLQLDSSFYALADALDKLPGLLHAAADEVTALRRLLEAVGNASLQEDVRDTPDSQALPGLTAALISEIEQVIVPSQAIQLQVDENRVQGDDPDWLQDGRYLKFIFRFQGTEEVLSRIKSFLASVTGFVHYTAEQGETLWEMVVADRSGGMNIIRSLNDSVRVQVWLPLKARPDSGRKGRLKLVKPSQPPGKTVH